MSDPNAHRHPSDRGEDGVSVSDEPLSDVVDRMDATTEGGQFVSLEGGSIRCLTCRTAVPAADIPAVGVRRLEGESDPADMSMTVPVTCPECATTGALVVRYGPDAGVADSDVLAAMPRPSGANH